MAEFMDPAGHFELFPRIQGTWTLAAPLNPAPISCAWVKYIFLLVSQGMHLSRFALCAGRQPSKPNARCRRVKGCKLTRDRQLYHVQSLPKFRQSSFFIWHLFHLNLNVQLYLATNFCIYIEFQLESSCGLLVRPCLRKQV